MLPQIFSHGTSAETNIGPPAVFTDATLATLTTTTATAIGAFTPVGSGTVHQADIYAMIENPSGVANTINIMVSQTTAADVIIIKRGSFCKVY